MKGKKLGLLLLILIVSLTTALAGCSNSGNKETNADKPAAENTDKNAPAGNASNTPAPADGPFEIGKEPLKFSFYVNYDWYAPKGFGSATTPTLKYFADEKKVTFEEISSNGNAAQKLGTMIASNEFPDVIQLDRGTDFDKLVEEGKLVALDPYLEKYPNLKELADPEMLKMLRSKDGKLYGIPNWFGNSKAARTNNSGWVINKKIYKELGSPKLETFDDLTAYLKTVKEKYPDVVPLDTANTNGGVVQVQNFIYGGMGEGRQTWYTKTDGMFAYPDMEKKEFTSIFDDPAFKESYKYTNQLFKDKLLTQDAFTQKLEQFTEKMNNGKIAVLATYDVAGNAQKANDILQPNDKEAGYDYVPYFYKTGLDPNKLSPGGYGTMGWNMNAITTSAKNPEAIFAFFDWLMSKEGTAAAAYGPPGLYWDGFDANGAPTPTEKYKTSTTEQRNAEKIGDFNMQGSPRWTELSDARIKQDPSLQTWGDKANRFYGKWANVNNDQFNNVQNFPANSEEKLVYTRVKQIMEKAVAKLVFAKNDAEFDAAYEAAKKEINDAGYDKLLKFMTNVWQENLKKIG
ncbi:extracellular solute-binding protein [Paenibacillus gansuensis]|uniref:Extracellular solute-binding protein n=1 Tax=Paenibacillus gansuensis TaxID=306542 RepID=A0ABW5PI56_9BACL